MRHLRGIHFIYAAESSISVPFCLIMTQTDDNHGALSTERAVVRVRIAAVLWLAAPATSRRRQPARRSPNEQVIYFMAHDQIPTRATAGYAPRNHICGGGCPTGSKPEPQITNNTGAHDLSSPSASCGWPPIDREPFFRCFHLLRTSKNRTQGNNRPIIGF